MNLRPLVVTGPIGSGKSTVSKLLEGFGALRVDLDDLGREILESPRGVSFVTRHWPATIDQGKVDRALLARQVFGQASDLKRLEAFVHPRAIELLAERTQDARRPVIEVSVPKLLCMVEGFVLLVDASAGARVSRLLDRNMRMPDIRSRMDSQLSRAEWLALADLVIPNASEKEVLEVSVRAVWNWWTGEPLNSLRGGDE